jgi:hypothetical protein
MGPSYTSSGSEDEETAAMAKAMGFSSFGALAPSKKRKFNPATDAVIEGQALAPLERNGRGDRGTGGNQIPLGKARVLGTITVPAAAPKGNTDEISLDDEEDGGDEGGEGIGHLDMSVPALAEGEDAEVEEDGQEPAYIDTSLPPPNEEARAVQERIDAILASNSAPATLMEKPKFVQKHPDRGVAQFMAQLQEAPPPLPVMTSQRPQERGQRNAFWYVGYYDPSFNENPWASLEKANGLQPRGIWLEREG